jgi:hypothetical protein
VRFSKAASYRRKIISIFLMSSIGKVEENYDAVAKKIAFTLIIKKC